MGLSSQIRSISTQLFSVCVCAIILCTLITPSFAAEPAAPTISTIATYEFIYADSVLSVFNTHTYLRLGTLDTLLSSHCVVSFNASPETPKILAGVAVGATQKDGIAYVVLANADFYAVDTTKASRESHITLHEHAVVHASVLAYNDFIRIVAAVRNETTPAIASFAYDLATKEESEKEIHVGANVVAVTVTDGGDKWVAVINNTDLSLLKIASGEHHKTSLYKHDGFLPANAQVSTGLISISPGQPNGYLVVNIVEPPQSLLVAFNVSQTEENVAFETEIQKYDNLKIVSTAMIGSDTMLCGLLTTKGSSSGVSLVKAVSLDLTFIQRYMTPTNEMWCQISADETQTRLTSVNTLNVEGDSDNARLSVQTKPLDFDSLPESIAPEPITPEPSAGTPTEVPPTPESYTLTPTEQATDAPPTPEPQAGPTAPSEPIPSSEEALPTKPQQTTTDGGSTTWAVIILVIFALGAFGYFGYKYFMNSSEPQAQLPSGHRFSQLETRFGNTPASQEGQA